MKSSILRLVLLAALSSGTLGAQQIKLEGNVEQLRSFLNRDSGPVVWFSGTGKHRVQTDQVRIWVVVITEAKTLAAAMEDNAKSRGELTLALAAKGISGSNVAYTPFGFTTESGLLSKKIRNYQLSSRLRITVTNESQFSATLRLMESRADEWEYVAHESRDSRQAQNEEKTMELAMKDIERQRDFYGERLNLKLTPHSFGDSLGTHGGFSMGGGGLGGGGGGGGAPVLDAMGNPIAAAPPMKMSKGVQSHSPSFGEVEYNVTLRIGYRIKPLDPEP